MNKNVYYANIAQKSPCFLSNNAIPVLTTKQRSMKVGTRRGTLGYCF